MTKPLIFIFISAALIFIIAGGIWIITHPELRSDIFGGPHPQPIDQVSPQIVKEVFRLLPPQKGVYLGAWDQDGVGMEIFEKLIGRTAPLFGGRCNQEGGAEGTRPTININCREEQFKKGYIHTYGIETYARKEDSKTISALPAGVVTPDDIIDGKIDTELKTIARSIANFGRPIFWLYHREPFLQFGGYGPDGTWPRPLCDKYPKQCNRTTIFGDKAKPDGPERYIASARHIHTVVESEIARLGSKSPIIWVMGALSEGERAYPGFYTEYFPGNQYVDWHAFNWYPLEKEGATIQRYESISQSPGWKEAVALDNKKPILIVEFGVSSLQGDRSGWFQSFFEDVRTNPAMKNLAGFIYWQEDVRYQQGESIRTRVPLTPAEERVWNEEVKAHPDYWNSILRFAE